MALQHAKHLAGGDRAISDADVVELHRLIFHRAWPSQAGEYRQSDVDAFDPIADLPPHHSVIRGEMLRFGRELQERTSEDPGTPAEAVECAIWTHMEAVRIHPFQEGNGRTARLAMNILLMRHVSGPSRPVEIPGTMRDRYLDCVQAARLGNTSPFADLLGDCLELMLLKAEREQERRLRATPRRP